MKHIIEKIGRCECGTKWSKGNIAHQIERSKTTTIYVFTLVGGPICWRFMIQSSAELYTTKAEYMVVVEAAKKAL